jgi:acyl carrier protein
MSARRQLNEVPEWKEIQRVLAVQAGMSENQLEEIGAVEADSLDIVELMMALEEKYKVKFPA